jgi:ATP-dependent RNA helicase DDX49/DBP8
MAGRRFKPPPWNKTSTPILTCTTAAGILVTSTAQMANSDSSDYLYDSEPSPGSVTPDPSNSPSESDSLDSSASRKRRKVSRHPKLDGRHDDVPIPSMTSVPSRITGQAKDAILKTAKPSNAILAPTDPQTTFQSLNVRPWLVASLNSMAIKRPTGIQKGCIPEILKGRDCIGGSRTGSGKTVAFAVPILQKWAEDPIGIFAVVLTPTRYEIMQLEEQ